MSSYPAANQSGSYMTSQECAKRQSVGDLEHLREAATTAFMAVGNAVDFDLVEMIAKIPFEMDQAASSATGARHAFVVQEANVV